MSAKIVIKKPLWDGKKIGIADYRMTENWLEIEIEYRTTNGKRLFPNLYQISKAKAMTYPVQVVKGTNLYIIPIKDLTITQRTPIKQQLQNMREYFIEKGVFKK